MTEVQVVATAPADMWIAVLLLITGGILGAIIGIGFARK